MGAGSRWSKSKEALSKDERYQAVPREDREAIFRTFVADSQVTCPPQQGPLIARRFCRASACALLVLPEGLVYRHSKMHRKWPEQPSLRHAVCECFPRDLLSFFQACPACMVEPWGSWDCAPGNAHNLQVWTAKAQACQDSASLSSAMAAIFAVFPRQQA